MSGYVNVELNAGDLIETMLSDGAFLEEVLTGMADGFHMGLLVDNAMDLFRSADPKVQELWINQFGMFVDFMKGSLE